MYLNPQLENIKIEENMNIAWTLEKGIYHKCLRNKFTEAP